ncbi:MAG: helix-turn-helix domain-containing protein [Ktedonobacteraceae bacterium]|jgi:excisionase family DNA binding protein
MLLITVKEAASILGVDESRIRQLVKGNRLTAQRFGNKMLILNRHEVEKFSKQERKAGRPKRTK